MNEEIAMRAFWTSFLDGLTGEGIFGDLGLPNAPTRWFKPEPDSEPLQLVESKPDTTIPPVKDNP